MHMSQNDEVIIGLGMRIVCFMLYMSVCDYLLLSFRQAMQEDPRMGSEPEQLFQDRLILLDKKGDG